VKRVALTILVLLGVTTLMPGCSAYQTYDRSHTRRVDVSYDAETNTYDLGYSIIPINPVKGYAK
jgi:hypothetical protein